MLQISHSTGWVASELNCQLTWTVDFTTHKMQIKCIHCV